MGSIASIITIASAPGTSVRQGLFPQSFSFPTLVSNSFYDWYIFTARTVKSMPIALLIAFLLPTVLLLISSIKHSQFKLTKKQSVGLLILIPFLTFLLMLATIVPYEFALSSYPDARVLITTQYVFISGMVAWGIILSGEFSKFLEIQKPYRQAARTVAALLVILGLTFLSANTIHRALAPIGEYRDFARSWDARHAFLQTIPEGSEEIIQTASLTHMGGLAEIGYDEDEWVNRCVAWFYGLEGVVAK